MLNFWALVTAWPFKCLQRAILGGAGTPIPYRIYVDSGFIFYLLMSLVVSIPLVTPFVLLYFLFCGPLYRRNLLYMYRPLYDSGGTRWPFLSDVLISAMVVAQMFLVIKLLIVLAFGPAIVAGLAVIPILYHRSQMRHKYYECYMDVALLQTSHLDGWEDTVTTSYEKREKFRKFLVDSHKAAYVPICLAGSGNHTVTSEPAVSVPLESDVDEELLRSEAEDVFTDDVNFESPMRMQKGALFRRVHNKAPSLIHRASLINNKSSFRRRRVQQP